MAAQSLTQRIMIIVLTGPMGCGKTTIGRILSEKLRWKFEDGDDFHPAENIQKMQTGVPLDDSDRLPWLGVLHKTLQDALKSDINMILACSALKRHYRRILGIDQKNIFSVYLKGSPQLLEQRVAARTHEYMNKSLLESQLATLEEPESGLIMSIDDSPENIAEKIISSLQIIFKK